MSMRSKQLSFGPQQLAALLLAVDVAVFYFSSDAGRRYAGAVAIALTVWVFLEARKAGGRWEYVWPVVALSLTGCMLVNILS